MSGIHFNFIIFSSLVQPPESLLYPVTLSLSNQVFTYIPNGDPVSMQPNNRLVMQLQSTQNALALVEREKENLAIELQLSKQQQHKSKINYFVNDDSDKSTTTDSDTQLIDLSSSISLDNYSIENIPNKSADNFDQKLLIEDSGEIFENSMLVDGERETLIRLVNIHIMQRFSSYLILSVNALWSKV